MKLYNVHYFDHVINRGRIQDIYAFDMDNAVDKWAVMRLESQETLSIYEFKTLPWLTK